MDRWERLKSYCRGRLGEAIMMWPDVDKSSRSRLRCECAYMLKHYHDILKRMEEFGKEEG